MPRKIEKYLYDIKESIDSIDDYLGEEHDFYKYLNNKMVKRAVERELEIIGEAINQILKINPDIEISEARRIVDLRNWVIHGYDKVDDVIIWGIISRDIPNLKLQVKSLMEKGS